MVNLGVKLDSKSGFPLDAISCVFNIFGAGQKHSSLRQLINGVTMTHPHLTAFVNSFKKRFLRLNKGQIRPAVFSGIGRFDNPTRKMSQILCTITNRQKGQFTSYGRKIGMGSLLGSNRIGGTR